MDDQRVYHGYMKGRPEWSLAKLLAFQLLAICYDVHVLVNSIRSVCDLQQNNKKPICNFSLFHSFGFSIYKSDILTNKIIQTYDIFKLEN